MIDIVGFKDGDLQFFDTDTSRAANILSVQIGSLEYEPELGIDLAYFLVEDFKVQNESFKSYLVEVLARNGINVVEVLEIIDALAEKYIINLSPRDSTSGMIAR